MKRLSTVLSFLSVLLVCETAYADKVSVDWDRQANFQQYKTYSWIDSKNPAEDQLMEKRIKQAVDGQLSARGLRKVDPGQDADLSVTYDSGVSQKVSWVPDPFVAPAWGWYGGPGPGWGPYWAAPGWGWDAPYGVYPLVQDVGTVAVNLVDEHQQQLVWRGVASDTLKENPEKNARKVCELIAKMFRKYPPSGSCCRHLSQIMQGPVVQPWRNNGGEGLPGMRERIALQLNFLEIAA
jgi:hypothetical protein